MYIQFHFFRGNGLPFLEENDGFLSRNIGEIALITLGDPSCFFFSMLSKHEDFDVNYYSDHDKTSIFGKALRNNNTKAVKIITKIPGFDPSKKCFAQFLPLHIVCKLFCDLEILKIVSSLPGFNVNEAHPIHQVTGLQIGAYQGNIYATEYLLDNFPTSEVDSFLLLFYSCIVTNHLMTLKILLKFYISKKRNLSYGQIVTQFVDKWSSTPNFSLDFIKSLWQIINEIGPKKVLPPKDCRPLNSARLCLNKEKQNAKLITKTDGNDSNVTLKPKPPESPKNSDSPRKISTNQHHPRINPPQKKIVRPVVKKK